MCKLPTLIGYPALAMILAWANQANLLAQQPETASPPFEVLARGPVHEAFLTHTGGAPEPGPIIAQEPPKPIDEIPPEMRPDERGVIWLSGYWFWDDEAERFIWVSGVWRLPPPGQRWVPGYWHQVDEGWQRVAGFWTSDTAEEMTYYPPPPEDQEQGPSSPPPSEDHFWVPGCWQYVGATYRWRAGFWSLCQDNWIWIPQYYCWTPCGVIRSGGFWDRPFSRRGMLFANMWWPPGIAFDPGWYFRPWHVIPTPRLMMHLFVRPSHRHYYYGDFYDPSYRQKGFQPWYAWYGSHRGHEPTFGWYQRHYGRQGINYGQLSQQWHHHFHDHADRRPPRTLSEQRDFAARRGPSPQRDYSLLAVPITDPATRTGGRSLLRVSSYDREVLGRVSTQLRGLGGQRSEFERGARVDPGRAGADAKARTAMRLPPAVREVTPGGVFSRSLSSRMGQPGVGFTMPRGGASSRRFQPPGLSGPSMRMPTPSYRGSAPSFRGLPPSGSMPGPSFRGSPPGGRSSGPSIGGSPGGGRSFAPPGRSGSGRDIGGGGGGGRSGGGGGGRSGGGGGGGPRG